MESSDVFLLNISEFEVDRRVPEDGVTMVVVAVIDSSCVDSEGHDNGMSVKKLGSANGAKAQSLSRSS